jgi:hypothetical protein
MSGFLGVQVPATAGQQRFTLYPYGSPPIEILEASPSVSQPVAGDGTQLWKLTHNGVDTHTLHFHLFNVQIINRVSWDNAVAVPDANELGWKETVRVNPLEDIIFAMRPVIPELPWDLPNSIRPIDMSKPLGAVLMGGPFGFKDLQGNPVTVINHDVNWGWEYVLHCHLLGHEEMDMMHGQSIVVAPRAPSGLTGTRPPSGTSVELNWTDNSLNETGFTVQRATDAGFVNNLFEVSFGEGVTNYVDTGLDPGATYFWRIIAKNLVGDNITPGFPLMQATSGPSNVVGAGPGGMIQLLLTAPNGGESYGTGSTQNVTWAQTGLSGLTTIDLYKGGTFVKTLGTADVTTGTFSWAIALTEAAGTDYRIRVSQGGAMDDSDANFTLTKTAFRADFNGDGQVDILWRYQAGGALQGSNVVWLTNQTAPPLPLALATQNLLAAMKPQAGLGQNRSSATPLDIGAPQTRTMVSIATTPLGMETALSSRLKKSMKDPLRSMESSARSKVRSQGMDAVRGSSLQDIRVASQMGSGTVGIVALGISAVHYLTTISDLDWQIVGTGDFNNDGSTDILWRNHGVGQYSGWNCIWYMNGETISSYGYPTAITDLDWRIVGTGDFNNDGSTDILWRNHGVGQYSGWNCIWYMNGETISSYGYPAAIADLDWEIAGAGDFNMDGNTDILWRNYGVGQYSGWNCIWHMNGDAILGFDYPPIVQDLNWRIVNR